MQLVDDLVAALRAELDEDERDARWSQTNMPGACETDPNSMRFDPERVLREVKAKRDLIADLLAEKHVVIEDDQWFTCAAAEEKRDGGQTDRDDMVGGPCDCGRDDRVERRLKLLAEPYEVG